MRKTEFPPAYTLPDGRRVTIRTLTEEDLPALEWEGEYRHFRRLYQQHYANCQQGNNVCWVACDADDQAIGQVFILLNARDVNVADGQHRAYLFSFRIRPQWRNQGLGNYIMSFVEEQLLLRGFLWLRLNVAKDNPAARRLYERRGYVVVGAEPGIWRYQDDAGEWQTVEEPAWKMIKALR